MPSRSTLVSEIQQLLTGERADPRAAQFVFLIPVAVELLLHLVADGPRQLLPLRLPHRAGPHARPVAIGKGWLSSRWTIWLPVLDMVALGVFRLSEGTAIGDRRRLPGDLARPAVRAQGRGDHHGHDAERLRRCPPSSCSGSPWIASRAITQVTLMAVICSGAVAMTAELWKAQVEQTRNSASRLERAMADVIEHRRLTRTIVNGVDVGLVAIDAKGAYDSMNPRHEDFMALAYPDGHGGRAGQIGFVYAADGSDPAQPRGHADLPGGPRRGLPRLPDLGRRGPGGATCPRRLLDAVLPHQRRLRWSRAGLPRHHRAGARRAHQGRVRRIGQPRAAHAVDLDHRLRRHHPRRHRGPSRRGARLPRSPSSATPGGCTGWSTTCSPPRCSRSPRSSTSSASRCRELLDRSAREAAKAASAAGLTFEIDVSGRAD